MFFALYYFVYFKAQDLIQNLLMNAAVYGEKVKGSAYPVYLFGKIGEGDLLAMLLYTAVIAVLCALTFVVLSRSFIKDCDFERQCEKGCLQREKRKEKNAFYGNFAEGVWAVFIESELYAQLRAWCDCTSNCWCCHAF